MKIALILLTLISSVVADASPITCTKENFEAIKSGNVLIARKIRQRRDGLRSLQDQLIPLQSGRRPTDTELKYAQIVIKEIIPLESCVTAAQYRALDPFPSKRITCSPEVSEAVKKGDARLSAKVIEQQAHLLFMNEVLTEIMNSEGTSQPWFAKNLAVTKEMVSLQKCEPDDTDKNLELMRTSLVHERQAYRKRLSEI